MTGSSPTDLLVARFLAGTLPTAEWNHRAHLRVGLWHLLNHSPPVALDLLRDRIRAYNIASGGANTETAGYHETITRFFVWQIDRFLTGVDRKRPIEELGELLIEQYGDIGLPLRYWSRERLMSPEARLGWVEPDLNPLESAGVAGEPSERGQSP